MEFRVKYDQIFKSSSIWIATIIRIILNLLLFIIVGALIIGVIKAGADLIHSIHKPLHEILQTILLDTVFILALTELTLTLLGYLKDGRVHVRYIIDTVLVIMLNELVTLWFAGATLEKAIGLSLIISVLGIMRFAAIRFAPEHVKRHEEKETEGLKG